MIEEEEIKIMFETMFYIEGKVKNKKVHWEKNIPFFVLKLPPEDFSSHIVCIEDEFKFFKLGLEQGINKCRIS